MDGQGEPEAVATESESEASVPLQNEGERQARERVWQAAERIGRRNRDRTPDEILAAVTDVVEEVRRERYERERTGA